MTIECSPQQIGSLLRKNEDAIFDSVHAAIVEAATAGERVVRSAVPVDQGGLRRETNTEVTGKRTGVIAEIVEDTPYAAAQEVGTRPFYPPIGPLIDWARRQGADPGLAYAVQKAIAARGIKAKFHTRDKALPRLRQLLGAALRRAAAAHKAAA